MNFRDTLKLQPGKKESEARNMVAVGTTSGSAFRAWEMKGLWDAYVLRCYSGRFEMLLWLTSIGWSRARPDSGGTESKKEISDAFPGWEGLSEPAAYESVYSSGNGLGDASKVFIAKVQSFSR